MRKIVFAERSVDIREAVHVELFCIEEIESHFYETLAQIMKQIKRDCTMNCVRGKYTGG